MKKTRGVIITGRGPSSVYPKASFKTIEATPPWFRYSTIEKDGRRENVCTGINRAHQQKFEYIRGQLCLRICEDEGVPGVVYPATGGVLQFYDSSMAYHDLYTRGVESEEHREIMHRHLGSLGEMVLELSGYDNPVAERGAASATLPGTRRKLRMRIEPTDIDIIDNEVKRTMPAAGMTEAQWQEELQWTADRIDFAAARKNHLVAEGYMLHLMAIVQHLGQDKVNPAVYKGDLSSLGLGYVTVVNWDDQFKRSLAGYDNPVAKKAWVGSKAPGWMRNLVNQVQKPLNEFYGLNISLEPDSLYGCGHFGCVFGTDDPHWVMKITRDPTEGPIVQALTKEWQDAHLPGIVEYHPAGVVQIAVVKHRKKDWPVYAYVREAVKPYEYVRPWREKPTEIRASGQLIKVMLLACKLKHLQTLKRRRPWEERKIEDDWLQAVYRLFDYQHTIYIGEAMLALKEDGILLADVHLGNIGVRITEGRYIDEDDLPSDEWVIFDPGHSSLPEGKQFDIPQLETPALGDPIPGIAGKPGRSRAYKDRPVVPIEHYLRFFENWIGEEAMQTGPHGWIIREAGSFKIASAMVHLDYYPGNQGTITIIIDGLIRTAADREKILSFIQTKGSAWKATALPAGGTKYELYGEEDFSATANTSPSGEEGRTYYRVNLKFPGRTMIHVGGNEYFVAARPNGKVIEIKGVAPQPALGDTIHIGDTKVSARTIEVNDKIEYLKKLTRKGGVDPTIRAQAQEVIKNVRDRDDRGEMKAIWSWVRDNIRFTSDPVDREMVTEPAALLRTRQEDCDGIAVLTGAMLLSVGHRVSLCLWAPDRKSPFKHVLALGWSKRQSRWIPVDPTQKTRAFGYVRPGHLETYPVT